MPKIRENTRESAWRELPYGPEDRVVRADGTTVDASGRIDEERLRGYVDWLIDRAYLLVPAQAYVGGFLATFKEYPRRQKAASFSLDQVMEMLTETAGAQ